MHAIVFQVDMKLDWKGGPEAELDMLVGWAKSGPGFVRGTWTSDGRRGLSFLVFESEAAARAVADNATPPPPESSVTFRSVDVYEVFRDV